jgi:enterochelin esterase-like enzyme
MIEPDPSDPERVLVTFLWNPAKPVVQACVTSSLFEPGPERLAMTPLGESGVWFRTVRLPANLRGSYAFYPAPAIPFDRPEEEWWHIFLNEVPDPLQPQTIRFPKVPDDSEDRDRTRSVVELPRAVSQPYVRVRPDVARGTIESFRFPSQILGGEHPIRVYRSPGEAPERGDADLVILFDGLAYEHAIPTPTIIDNLRAEGRIDPLVVVLWDYPLGGLRNVELECNPALADSLERELLPWLRSRYGVTSEPDRTVVGGSSAGGLGAAYVAYRYPGSFGKVLSQSGWFACAPSGVKGPPGWLPAQFEASPRLPLEFYLDAGTRETDPGMWAEGILQSNRSFREILQQRGYPVHYAEFVGGHDCVNWRGTLSDGLLALLPKRPKREVSG